MNRKTTGILAGAAGAALLIGGGTFALWSDSVDVDGATITTGNLQIEASEMGWTWYDTSAEVVLPEPLSTLAVADDELGDPIDAETFRIVPGDEVTGFIEFSAALEGTNLKATLGSDLGGFEGSDWIDTVVSLQYWDGTEWVAAGPEFFSEDNPAKGTAAFLPADLPAEPNVRARVVVTFDSATPDREVSW